MAYSNAMFQGISILLYIHVKIEEGLYDYLSTRSISETLNIPAPTAVKVLNKLNAAGLTHTKEGAKGGILLSKPVHMITLLDVFTAIEQEKPLFKVQYKYDFEYEALESILASGISALKDAEAAMKASLGKTTLANLLK